MKQIWKIEYMVDFDAKNPKITTVFSLGNLMITLTPLQLFKNLSDETRLNIILLLRESGELCVCELCDTLNESQPKISRHLAMLRESGLCWIAVQGSGFTIVCHLIFLPGRQP